VKRLPAGAISLQGVGKEYTKYEDTPTLAYGLLHLWSRSSRSKLWALRDFDLEVQPGESIGIVGHNGSGKTTLLSMLCGVTGPSTGRLHVAGRIAPLISVGVGFHPELTGRENVYINGTILGMSRRELDRRLDEIVDFSEVEDFIDTPVKFYSSGMYVRLGFSVAAHVDPDVLLIDEILSVGDGAFQWKCFKYMRELRARGTTIVLVSHNLPAVENYCDRAVVLQRGRKMFDGPVAEAVETYQLLQHGASADGDVGLTQRHDTTAIERGVVDAIDVSITDDAGKARARLVAGDHLVVHVKVNVRADINAPYLVLSLIAENGLQIYSEHNLFSPYPRLAAGESVQLTARFPLYLATGSYTLETTLFRAHPHSREPVHLPDDVAMLSATKRTTFFVQGRDAALGLVDLPTTFDVEFADRSSDAAAPS
jgi:ABC-type polysaccharide/polyol phosphate transport system ATPase subunit